MKKIGLIVLSTALSLSTVSFGVLANGAGSHQYPNQYYNDHGPGYNQDPYCMEQLRLTPLQRERFVEIRRHFGSYSPVREREELRSMRGLLFEQFRQVLTHEQENRWRGFLRNSRPQGPPRNHREW